LGHRVCSGQIMMDCTSSFTSLVVYRCIFTVRVKLCILRKKTRSSLIHSDVSNVLFTGNMQRVTGGPKSKPLCQIICKSY